MIETVLASKTDRSIYKAFLHLGVFQRFVSSGLKLQFLTALKHLSETDLWKIGTYRISVL